MSLADKSISIFNRELFFTAIRIGTGAIVARKLGPTGVGVWAVLDLLINYCRVFGGPRLEIASVHFLGKKESSPGEILFLINLVGVSVGLFFFTLISMGQGWLSGLLFKVPLSPLLIVVVLAHLPFLFLSRNYIYFLLSQENVRAYNRLMMLQDGLRGVVTITLLLFFGLDLWALAIGLHAGNLTALAYGMIVVHRKITWRWRGPLGQLPKMLRYSMKIYFSEATGFLTLYLSNLITAILLTPAALAFFSMGKGKAEWLNRIPNAVGTILYPRISNLNGENRDAAPTTTRAFRISFITVLIVCSLIALAMYPATLILYGRPFLPLLGSFFIILPGLVLFSPSGLLRQYFLGVGRPEVPIYIQFVPLVIQVLFCYLLIPPLGFVGGALAVSISYLSTAIVTLMVYRKLSHTNYTDLLMPTAEDFLFLREIFCKKLRALRSYFPVKMWGIGTEAQ